MKKLLLLILIVFVSCEPTIVSLVNFKGSTIVQKDELWSEKIYYKVLIQGEFGSLQTVYITEYDFKRYNLGDTIK